MVHCAVINTSVGYHYDDSHNKIAAYVGLGLASGFQVQIGVNDSDTSYRIRSDITFTSRTLMNAIEPRRTDYFIDRLALSMSYTGFENSDKNYIGIGLGLMF